MDRSEAICWVLSVCIDLRRSQAKTLSQLVAATLSIGRVSLGGDRPAALRHDGQAWHQARLAFYLQRAVRAGRRHARRHPQAAGTP